MSVTLPTGFVKDIFDGLIRLEEARLQRYRTVLNEVLSALAPKQEVSPCVRTSFCVTGEKGASASEISQKILNLFNEEKTETTEKPESSSQKQEQPDLGPLGDMIKAFQPMMTSFMGSVKKAQETVAAVQETLESTTQESRSA